MSNEKCCEAEHLFTLTSVPTNTNKSIIEIPVTISGFIIGMFVTFIIVFVQFVFCINRPTEAITPSTVETTIVTSASKTVF